MKLYNLTYNRNNLTIGEEKIFCGKTPTNWIIENGQLLSKIEYPLLYQFAIENELIVSETEWQQDKLYALFAYGENPDYFRIPDKRGLSPIGFEENYHLKNGQYQQDQIVNITGKWQPQYSWTGGYALNGAFADEGTSNATGSGGGWKGNGGFNFNASRVVKTGARVQARGFTANWLIKYR